MSQVAFPQLFLVEKVIDIDGPFTYVTSQFLDKFARNASQTYMGGKPSTLK
jgi:hypothetical protein